MNPKLQTRVAHVVNGKAADQRPDYYDLIKFPVQKEAETNFNEAKKTRDSTSKPKATMHFHFNHKKSGLPATPAVWMVRKDLAEKPHPFQVRRATAASPMKLDKKTQPFLRVMWRLLSQWPRHLRHLQVDASDVIRWDINSVMRNVKCLAPNF